MDKECYIIESILLKWEVFERVLLIEAIRKQAHGYISLCIGRTKNYYYPLKSIGFHKIYQTNCFKYKHGYS